MAIEFDLAAKKPVEFGFDVKVQSGGGSGGGGVQSAQIDEIRVMMKTEYDALAVKDARTLYLVEG